MPGAEKVPVAALRLLLERGYDATSVEDLAVAAGISRSTFFRRYGSKDDMVFADLDERINVARTALLAHRAEGTGALVPAALAVFDHASADTSLALARWELLHAVPSLRDRELVSTHRFQRLFRDHLLGLPDDAARPSADRPAPAAAGSGTGARTVSGTGPGAAAGAGPGAGAHRPDARRTRAVALAAAVVAVHNDHLRSWLRSPGPEVRPALRAALLELVAAHAEHGTVPAPTVVVVPSTSVDPAAVGAAVEQALRGRA